MTSALDRLPLQVNVPKTKRAYCKNKECRKHTVHKVTQYKSGKASLYAQGTWFSSGEVGRVMTQSRGVVSPARGRKVGGAGAPCSQSRPG